MIAAFIMFSGTASRTEALMKGLNRVIGTLAGLVAATWLADLTTGHTAWVLVVIVVSAFWGFYLFRVSYAYMIFFLTIMLGQLYSVLHEFSPGLLILRLEETAIGAAVGFAVAAVVVPLSTRDMVGAARRNLLMALSDLLAAAADRLDGAQGIPADFDSLTRALDDRLRRLLLVATPLTGPMAWGISPRTRHRLSLFAAAANHSRALAVAVRQPRQRGASALALECRALSATATQLAQGPVDAHPAAAAAARHGDKPVSASAADPIARPLAHLRILLLDLATAAGDPL